MMTMKKIFVFLSLAAFSLLFSCAKDAPIVELTDSAIQDIDIWTPRSLKEVAPIPGSSSVMAGFGEETKSHLDVGGSQAAVIWDASDQFKMIGYDSQGYSYVVYTNTSGAVAKATFETESTITRTDNGLHSIYPGAAFIGLATTSGPNYFLKINIPSTQTATVGSVAPGANISYARSDTQTGDLHFQNAVSIIKFTLSGDAVSGVTKVSFKGTAPLTGEFFLTPTSSSPAFDNGVVGARFTTATLEGSFEANKDYYLAVAPGVQDGFMMTFTNSADKVIKRVSNKSLTLNRSVITDLGAIDIGSTFPDSDPTVIQYMTNTYNLDHPATIVVLPDGYKKSELDTYEIQAKDGIDALFSTEPYNKYRGYFNVWILKVASKEKGANITNGNGVITTARDCYFQSKWGEGYRDMEANSNRIFSFVENNCPDILNGATTIDKVSILLLINDDRYGGICHSYSNGKNYAMVPIVSGSHVWKYASEEAESKTAVPWNKTSLSEDDITSLKLKNTGTWHNILVHEFGGHAFGRLLDEYWSTTSSLSETTPIDRHNWPVPMGLNLSATNVDANTPWHELLTTDNKETMAAKSIRYSRIGVFQGGDNSMFYRWRSERISCMIDNRLYFSTWQRWLIVNRIMSVTGSSDPYSFSTFLYYDVMYDPVADAGNPSPLPVGLVNILPPHPSPLLPPPVLHDVD